MAVSDMEWAPPGRSLRVIFLVGDTPSHDYGDGVTTRVWARKAHERDIVINTVQCGTTPETATEFKLIAELASGAFLSTGQSGNVSVTKSPYDDDLTRNTRELERHTLVAGSAAARRDLDAALASLHAMSATSAADRLSYRAKEAPASGPGVKDLLLPTVAGTVDLTESPASLAGLPEDQLPPALRKVPRVDRLAFLLEAASRREAARDAVLELTRKRDAWLASHEAKDGFDVQLLEALKRQATAIDVAY